MLKEFFLRNPTTQIGLNKNPIKIHYISPIPIKKNKSQQNKMTLKKNKNDNKLISNYQNYGLLSFTHKYLRNERLTSKSSLKTQTNSTNFFLTTSSTFNNLEKSNSRINQTQEKKNSLMKKKRVLQNKIKKLKIEKLNLLNIKKQVEEDKNKIRTLKFDINRFDILIKNCKKDFNNLSLQCTSLKDEITKILVKQNNK